ncbi:hypothetical protein [Desulfobacula sp.]|uniref:hypothetical protein n=1 Tax=Desulfobacula sp. TaxID=2593537 RepID=UPI00260370E1|nr:hypothetical protein [Desulfobacula sp.]
MVNAHLHQMGPLTITGFNPPLYFFVVGNLLDQLIVGIQFCISTFRETATIIIKYQFQRDRPGRQLAFCLNCVAFKAKEMAGRVLTGPADFIRKLFFSIDRLFIGDAGTVSVSGSVSVCWEAVTGGPYSAAWA